MSRKSPKKQIQKYFEYGFFFVFIRTTSKMPWSWIPPLSDLLGKLFYAIFKKRRHIALENIHYAFGNKMDAVHLTKQSFSAFFRLLFETLKLRQYYSHPDIIANLKTFTPDLNLLWGKAKKIHDETSGCIFVTPHIGNWEYIPFISRLAGIPLTVVTRPLDNEYLEKYLYANRMASGQTILPKGNAMLFLKKCLKRGRSIGLLPDQGAVKGIPVQYFGRTARTSPIPALLSIQLNRPVVVVACCRTHDMRRYEGYVSDPLWAGSEGDEKDQMFRLTQKINDVMEDIIRKYPDQYFWFHDRWQDYGDVRKFFT